MFGRPTLPLAVNSYTPNASALAIDANGDLFIADYDNDVINLYPHLASNLLRTLNVTNYTVNDGNGGNNYAVTTLPNFNGRIFQAPLTLTAAASTKSYDSTTGSTILPSISGLRGADTVTGVESYVDKNVGSRKTLSVSAYTINDGYSGNNYTVKTMTVATGVINKAPLTITAITNTKTYDSKTTVGATPTVTGLQGADTATGLLEVYNDRNGGADKTLSVSNYTVNDGNSGNNYSVTTLANTAGVISQASLTITATTNTKMYDATTAATAAPIVAGLLGADTATGLAEQYSDRNAGSSKTVSVKSFQVNDGNGGNNYTVTTVANTEGVINKAPLTITAKTNTKTYDSTTSAAATPTVSRLKGNDSVTGLAEVYSSTSATAGKTISVLGSYLVNDGNNGNNYTVTTANVTTGAINKAPLTITALTNTKTYDSTTVAAAVPTVSGLIGSDTVTALVESYTNPRAGTAKTLSVSAYTINDGNNGGDYTVLMANNSTGAVNKVSLTLTALTNTKNYDGTTSASVVPIASALIGKDTLVILTEAYADKNVGSGKTLSVNAYSINDGNNGNNYAVTTVTNATGVINKSPLTIIASTNTTTYLSSTFAAATPTVSGLFRGDAVSAAEAYADANVGSKKVLSVTAYTVVDGNGGGNYQVTTVNDNTGVIFKYPLTLKAVSNMKTYDSNTTASANVLIFSTIGNDRVTASEVYTDPNAGTGKTLSVSSYTINDGNGGNNYIVTTLANDITGVITPSPLTITAAYNSKTYDSTTTAAATPVVSGLKGGDTVTGVTEVYNSANASNNTPSATLSGIEAANDLAFDRAGNLYVVSQFDVQVSVFAPGATSPTSHLTGLNKPVALAFDDNGDLFIANTGNNTVSVFTPGATSPTATLTGLSEPRSLAVDSKGDLYVGNFGNHLISVFAPGASTPTTEFFGFSRFGPRGLAFDANGDLFAALSYAGLVFEFFPGATTPSIAHNGLINLSALALDNDGNLYVANDTHSGTVSKFAPGATVATTKLVGLNFPHALAIDPNGNMYVSNSGNGTISRFAPGATVPNTTFNGLSDPDLDNTYQMAFDNKGNIFVLNGFDDTASEFANAGAATSTILSVSDYTVNDGNGGNNYTVTTVASSFGVITPAPLSVTGLTAKSKIYDGTVAATVTLSNLGLAGAMGGDSVTLNTSGATGAFVSKNVGKNIEVDVAGLLLVGASTGNYSLTRPTLRADVTPAPLTLIALTDIKNYDGSTAALTTPTVSALVTGDTITGVAEVYSDKNVGTGRTLSVSAFTINDGNGGHNYAVTTLANTTGEINKALLLIQATTNTKSWDGTTLAAALPTVAGLGSGDTVSGLAEIYSDTNVATGKTLSVSAYTVNDGNGGKNYTVAVAADKTGVIGAPNSILTLPASLTVIEPPQGMTYTVYLPLTVNLQLNYTVSYQTVGGSALAGSDFTAINPGTVHVNDANNTQPSVLIPITIRSGAYQQPGGPAFKSFTVQLNYAVNNGSGNALTQSLTGMPNTVATINLQQVFAPKISIAANQASASQGIYVNLTTYWPSNSAYSAAQYAQAGGDVYLNYSTAVGGAFFSSATVRIAAANFTASGTFLIANVRLPSKPPSGMFTMMLVAVTSNAAIDPSGNIGMVGYP